MQRKISTVIADKILWNCIEANNVWSCTMSFQSSLYTYSACDLHYSSALVVTSPLSIPIQTNWRLHSHSILSLISRPRSTHLQYGKCSHNITRDHWNETNLIIYSNVQMFLMTECFYVAYSLYPSFWDIVHVKQCMLREN